MTTLVTKDSLRQMLEQATAERKAQIIGRALVALYDRQTEMEKSSDGTHVDNNVGFSGSDARQGSLSAKFFLKHKTLLNWQTEIWMRSSRGYPRICKYARQLNEIAEEKRARKNAAATRRLDQLRMDYGMSVDSDDPKILEPIVKELRQLELQLGVQPYIIMGAVA